MECNNHEEQQDSCKPCIRPGEVLTFWDMIRAKFAMIGHTHNASDIDTGVLSVERGGTGGATAEEVRDNLGLAGAEHTHDVADVTNAAVADHTHEADDELSAISANPVQNKVIYSALAEKADADHTHAAADIEGVALEGHTHEAADIDGVALEDHTHAFGDITGTVPINQGGTNATTAKDARDNLGAAAINHTHYAVATVKEHFVTDPPVPQTIPVGGGYVNFNMYLTPSGSSIITPTGTSGVYTGLNIPKTGNYLVSAHLGYRATSDVNPTIAIAEVSGGTRTIVARAMMHVTANDNYCLTIPMQFVQLTAGNQLRLYVSLAGTVANAGGSLTAMFFDSGMM